MGTCISVKLLPGGVDYFYSATNRRSRAASWSIFAPPRTPLTELPNSQSEKRREKTYNGANQRAFSISVASDNLEFCRELR